MLVPTLQDSKFSILFDGISQYMNVGKLQGQGLSLNKDWFSLMFWMKTGSTGIKSIAGIIDSGNSNFLGIRINQNNANANVQDTLHMFIRDNNNFFNNVSSDTSIPYTDNLWHPIMIQIQPSAFSYQFYIDKKACPMVSASNTVLNHWTKFVNDFVFGGENSHGTVQNFFPGLIYNPVMFRTKLTFFDFIEYQRGMMKRQDIFAHWRMSEGKGNIVKETVNGLNGTLINNVNDNMWSTDTPFN